MSSIARKNLVKKLAPKSLAILHANDVYPTNADGTLPFIQNSDLFYLTGIDQEETILILAPDAPDKKLRELLFLRETNEHIAIWEGERLSKEEASRISGIPMENIHWLDQFDRHYHALIRQADHVYLNTNEHARAVVEVETRDTRFIRRCQREYPLHRYERLAPLLQSLRIIKSVAEIAVIKQAIAVTESAFRRVLNFVKPGVMENEVEAEIIHEFIRSGAQGHAFSPIIASGKNACVLHYVQNNRRCEADTLLLLDFGARFGGYNADLTRTIPVSGRFTKRQREVYNAVLTVHRAARKLLKPGVLLREYQEQVGLAMQEELIKLKLLDRAAVKKQDKDKPLYKKYFMHGTSHHLGLDVHDVGDPMQRVAPGMVFTIEPGIYIREEGLGIRLENDVLITKTGNADLMPTIPIDPDEIESLMQTTKVRR
ncbi:M24 family metallopeptidase [Phragmitibacter flavus]|uniref:Xaa-Pro aminopeptidase n=1 Tax=Phragmitibacter flavus TaxID=2576071 RepID=A0A5R8KHQ9_9BACT|nr:aminopeptidase P N-terminal domain-containing protein [Phragmitibacter flavus]TLD71797.1 M24 family metallopeptidase [Phragmitibacter flavus]